MSHVNLVALLYVSGGEKRVCFIDDEQVGLCLRATGDWVKLTGDGQLYFLGRIDDQVKRNGKRMNLTAIEKVYIFF